MEVTHFVKELKPNEIFIFGANEAGEHLGGAAKTALQWGAEWGVGEGLAGQTYALPTVNATVSHALSLKEIQKYVDNLYICIKDHPELFFILTEVGCNIAGFVPEQIAPLFRNFMNFTNMSMPPSFIKILNAGSRF